MSKEYREAMVAMNGGKKLTKKQLRTFCSRPGAKMEDGSPLYMTEQSHKRECDINYILKKYDKTGLITNVSKFEAQYGDIPAITYKEAMDLVTGAQRQFDILPSNIRKRFDHDPAKFLEFFENSENRKEAIELGLINPNWTELTDGLGEHVKFGENVEIEPEDPKADSE